MAELWHRWSHNAIYMSQCIAINNLVASDIVTQGLVQLIAYYHACCFGMGMDPLLF
jgi:hypothetical protein